MLFTNDKDLARKAMLMSGAYETNWKKHFLPDEEDEQALGSIMDTIALHNFRISNLSAALIRPQLKDLEKRVEHFNSNFDILSGYLKELDNHVRLPEVLEEVRPAFDSIQFEFKGMTDEAISHIASELKKNSYTMGTFFKGRNARCCWNWSFFSHLTSGEKTRGLLKHSIDMRLHLYRTKEDMHNLGRLLTSLIQEAALQ
jgi:dTDP-4-amino-4,6-dideoxygalactose transaminase